MFNDIRALWQVMGPLRFAIFFGGLTAIVVGYVAIGLWLESKIGWPDAYGFHCQGRGCLWIGFAHSFQLLAKASFFELLLFAWFWAPPATAGLGVAIILTRRWLKRRRERIRPLR